MPSPEVLEFEPLLAPIPGDNPAGEDLRANPSPTSPYYAVKDARNTARAAERQMIVEGEETANPPDWRPVLKHGTKALTEKTKDLEIVAYMIETLVREYGFAGLRDGFRLARELVEKYWDNLYPQPDEEGLVTRVAPLTGLNGEEGEGTLINPIAKVPLTQGRTVGPFAYFQYQQALGLNQVGDEAARQARIEQGHVPLETFQQALTETSGDFVVNLVADLTQCQEEFAKLGNLLDEKCGPQAPPTSNIRSALDACLDVLRTLARDKLAMQAPTEEAAEGAPAGAVSTNGAPAAPGAIRNREDAFLLLLKVADYFRRSEPHTPVSYALEQAVRWGRMPLPDLIAELVPDETAREMFFNKVGIPMPAAPPSE